MLPKAVLVDVDGTLVDVENIRHHVTQKKKDFETFHRQSIDCKPNTAVLSRVRALSEDGFRIIIVTGRESRFKRLTEFWLAMWNVPCDELEMRKTGDNRRDLIIKSEIFEKVSLNFDVIESIDDTPELINLWIKKGIPSVINAKDLKGSKNARS